MSRISITRKINAPTESVFNTIADSSVYSKAVPDITDVEILSEVKSGVGTRFRETRLMNGKEAATELEVTEYVENDRIRMVADAGGTVWDSVFTVKAANGSTELKLVMDAKPYKFLAKVMNPLMKGMIEKAVGKDMDAVKVYCEK